MHTKFLRKKICIHQFSTKTESRIFGNLDTLIKDVEKHKIKTIINDTLGTAKQRVDELKKETVNMSLDSAMNMWKEAEMKMIENKLNNVNCSMTVNLGFVSFSMSKLIKIE